ncbi:alpha/beta hydrolase-fold protein [Paraflavitalea sp. CAU 1676]|uniref:alpha/beta hydrolase n=1 Tax=Paraflavitalea sp. CAU 1676 TaxID=3032598 RepID=UPI0023DB6FDF|nr:alpha/beta hydrolase-fold protein [Paraflavitalea sp. CAU 1676]MDF2192163.1 alpha/beta hydrolase-fold protein [Paraflavitalea sp. CAU 1676]
MALVLTKVQAQYPAVTIPGSEVRKITSKIVAGQEYELHIMLPRDYKTADKKYPVVYQMDAQWDFKLVTGLYGDYYYDGFIPELIIVGVTWSGEQANYDSLRKRDYTPTKIDAMPQSGGADQFLAFMKQELFPFIESNYKADGKNRTLMGCSGGAVFTLYTLFTQPDLFTGYVAASPYIPWDNEVLYKFEQAFAKKRLPNPVRLYMTMGDVETTRPVFEKFSANMVARQYPSVRLQSKILENTGHSGTKHETYARGLQYVFERPQLNLAAGVLNSYAGTYQLPDGRTMQLKNDNSQLALYFGSNRLFTLYAASETDFYATAQFFNIHFDNASGKPPGCWLETFGNKQFVKRTN